MRKIGGVVSDLVHRSAEERPHAPTLWDLASEYPAMVRVDSNPAEPLKSFAVVKVPYSPDAVRLLRACKGAFWVPEAKA
jgi:hypothetical protein